MPALADLFVGVRPDTSGFKSEAQRGIDRADLPSSGDKAGRGFGSRFASSAGSAIKAGAVGIAVAAAGAGVLAGKFLGGAITSASDLAETGSKIDVLFGKSAGNIKKWSKSMASDFGQSQQSALDAAATFAVYGKQAGFAGSKLFNFSTDLTGLASDMASFSNTSPEEAIQAIGAAFRGESDPIEKYGVLLNENVLKQVALKNGIISTTTGALTPQQRVLAVQAALYEQLGKKGSGAIGDFERTSGGLANQTRILKADFANFKTEIGTGLLPVVQRFVGQLNTKVMPALRALWAEHGPAITAFLTRMGDKFTAFIVKLTQTDWKTIFGDLRQTFDDLKTRAGPALDQIKNSVGPIGDSLRTNLVPAAKELSAEGGGLSDTLSVTGTVMKFLADNIDLLADALPYLLAGLVAVKIAQLASNVALAISPVLRLLEWQATKRQTAAIIEQTGVLTANKAALVTATAATGAQTAAENTGLLTRIRNTAATVGQRIATVATSVATKAAAAGQWLLNAALSANPIGLVVIAIIALIAIVVLAYQKNETFRKIVQAVWAAIKAAISAVGNWFVNTLWPSLRKAIDQLSTAFRVWLSVVKAVWGSVFSAISATWGFIRDRVFNPLKSFITKTIPDAFTSGTAAIGRIWKKVQDLAAVPVRFVVDTVINKGIIGTFNKVSGFFNGPSFPTVSVPGLAAGGFAGRLPGAPSSVDNLLGMARGKMIGLAGGEYVVNAKQTARNLPLLEAINSGISGYADGGFLGFLRNPAKWVSDRVGLGAIVSRFGNNPISRTLTGMGGKLKDALLAKVKGLLDFGDGGGSAGAGGLRSGILQVLGSLRSVFGNVPIISGFRPGATTLTGNTSYHASGRAVDVRAVEVWARYLKESWGSKLRELITPWQKFNVLNGRAHTYTGAVWNQHNFAGGNAHIHAALAKGGRLRSFDTGGRWPSGTAGVNTSGKTEHVATGDDMSTMVELLGALLDAITRLAPDIGREINGVGSTLRTRGRTGAWPRST